MFFLFGSLTTAQKLQKTSPNPQKSPHSYRLMPGFTYIYIQIAIILRNALNIKCYRSPLTNTRPLSGKSYPVQVSSHGSLVRSCAGQGFHNFTGGKVVDTGNVHRARPRLPPLHPPEDSDTHCIPLRTLHPPVFLWDTHCPPCRPAALWSPLRLCSPLLPACLPALLPGSRPSLRLPFSGCSAQQP